MEILVSVLAVFNLIAILWVYHTLSKANQSQNITVQIPEIKIIQTSPNHTNQATTSKEIDPIQIQKDYEAYVKEQEEEQERLPEKDRVMSDVNEAVNSIYDAFLEGNPIND